MLTIIWDALFHRHKWKIIDKNRCTGDFGTAWTRYYVQCEKCGKVKVMDP